MDEKCDICEGKINDIDSRFYLAYADCEQHQESWTALIIICPRCFWEGRRPIIKERG